MDSTTPSAAEVIVLKTGEQMAAPLANDPLTGWTRKQIFIACVWRASIRTAKKIFLLCVARFFDDDAQSSSMSYKQVARECGLHETTAKAIAKSVTLSEVEPCWLKVDKGQGLYVPGKGCQNLYHGTPPQEHVEYFRAHPEEVVRYLGHEAGSPDTTPKGNHEVASQYPELERGRLTRPRNAFSGSPETLAGSSEATRTTLSHQEKGEKGAHAPPPSPQPYSPKSPTRESPPPTKEESARKENAVPVAPHFNGRGFLISKDFVLEQSHVEEFRKSFPEADLETDLPYLAGVFLKGKGRLNFPDCPEAWFRKKLKEDADKVRRETAKGAKKTSRRGELNEL